MSWKKPMKGIDVENQLDNVIFPKFVQPKYDGIRVIFYNGIALSSSFKPLGNEMLQRTAHVFSELDGVECEYYIPPSEGGFREATSICRNADRKDVGKGVLYAFDIFSPVMSYNDRLHKLDTIIHKAAKSLNIAIAPTWKVRHKQEVQSYLKLMLENSFEGIMLKDPEALYKQGRSTIKSQECLKYQLPFWVSGFTMEQKEAMWLTRDKLVGRKLCFKHQPCGCYDAPRHPIFRRWL